MYYCLLPQGGSEGLLSPDGPAIAEGKGCVDPSSLPLLPHPAKKQVWDFVRVLLMDSLLNIPANKQGHPLELLLEVSLVIIRLCCSTLHWGLKGQEVSCQWPSEKTAVTEVYSVSTFKSLGQGWDPSSQRACTTSWQVWTAYLVEWNSILFNNEEKPFLPVLHSCELRKCCPQTTTKAFFRQYLTLK